GHDGQVPAHTAHTQGVVAGGAGDAGDHGAVPVGVVGDAAGAVEDVRTDAGHEVSQVGVRAGEAAVERLGAYAGVHDRDDHCGHAGVDGPGLGGVDALQVPLRVEERIVGDQRAVADGVERPVGADPVKLPRGQELGRQRVLVVARGHGDDVLAELRHDRWV